MDLFSIFNQKLFFSATIALPDQSVPLANIWWVPLASALIGAISALATPVLKDVLIQTWSDRRTKKINQREIYRNYAAPLIASSERLIWRFGEIFIDKRHQFLKTSSMPKVYNKYKRNSTLYRIGSVMGWVRAINLELNALPRGASGFLAPISSSIAAFQSALADGPHVEIHRLEQLCGVWKLDIGSIQGDEKNILATNVEVKLYELAGDKLKNDSAYLVNMTKDEKENICRYLSNYLCEKIQKKKIDDQIISETVNQAIAAMSYREALIYRDWQDAIGDAMLEKDPESVRRFKVIGYEKFEEIIQGNAVWFEVFRESIDDLDFEIIDQSDFRLKQLKDLSVAIAKILISISHSDEKDLINDSALELAKKLVSLSDH